MKINKSLRNYLLNVKGIDGLSLCRISRKTYYRMEIIPPCAHVHAKIL